MKRSSSQLFTHTQHNSAFSLIELLVVIAVVSTLVGTLLPVLSRARGQGQTIQCASNIRQLALANELYAQDHEERYMPGAAGIQRDNLRRWHGLRAHINRTFEPNGAPISEYLDGDTLSNSLRACPTFQPQLNHLELRGKGFERGCGGYGYNTAFVGSVRREATPGVWIVQRDDVGSKRARFRGPARTVAFADSAFADQEVIEYSFIEPAWWPQSPHWRPDPSVHFRHAGGANIAWLDGHVSSEIMSHSESSGFYPLDPRSNNIGWFGNVDTNDLFDYR